MRAIILNSGLGHRMGDLTKEHPKCMTILYGNETILSRQLKMLSKHGINKVIITTGYFDNVLINYCYSLNLTIDYKFIKNPLYDKTNYIYSIFCAREELDDDVLLMHGDIVFDESVLIDILSNKKSCMKVSSTIPLPNKDFKAVVKGGRVLKVGVDFFDSALEAQAFYKLNKKDWKVWLDEIVSFCERGKTDVYAENALNNVSNKCNIFAFDAGNRLCTEIDTPDDLLKVKEVLKNE